MQDNATGFGSYVFENMESVEEEVERLVQQARAIIPMEKRILSDAGIQPGMEVLDAACTTGITSCILAELTRPGQVLGIHPNDRLLAFAQAYATRMAADNVSFAPISVYGLDKLAGRFDFAYARLLLQHLEEPRRALENIRQTLKPGGIICCMDIDDDWLTLYPEPPGFSTFKQKSIAGQAEQGGDRLVGRKLGPWLQEAGFEDVRVSCLLFSSGDVGLDTFFQVALAFKTDLLPAEEREKVRQMLQGIQARAAEETGWGHDTWGYAGVFVATGRCPG